MKSKNWTRKQTALYLIIATIATSIIFGLIFGTFIHFIENEPKSSFISEIFITTKFFFDIFFAGGVVSGILLFITKIEEEFAYYLGFALYYGTLILGSLIKKLCNPTEGAYLIGLIITTMASYITWLIKKNTELNNTIRDMQFSSQFKSKE